MRVRDPMDDPVAEAACQHVRREVEQDTLRAAEWRNRSTHVHVWYGMHLGLCLAWLDPLQAMLLWYTLEAAAHAAGETEDENGTGSGPMALAQRVHHTMIAEAAELQEDDDASNDTAADGQG